MAIETNKAVVRQLFEQVLNNHDLELADTLIDPQIVMHDPMMGVATGVSSFKQLVALFLTAFPQQHTTVDHLVAEGEYVVALHTHRATHTGPFMGIPPTGKDIIVEGLELFRLADGKIVEFWRHDDDAGLLQQLGAIPVPAQAM
jgi:steroid delta-isomerase-like uncharacterized protein